MNSERIVLVETADLVFRAKLDAVVQRAGWRPVRKGPADVVVVELAGGEAVDRVRQLVADGVTVLAFGAHVHRGLLQDARTAGAQAVPNSQIEAALARALGIG